ncbi:MAG: zinc-binding dehydrogenase [Deltaproteobacteria bacterium]|nr:zinc-binding dehydrogenase [Deltaproteobacteria bacterium]
MDYSTRLKTIKGEIINSFFAQSSWAQYAVIDESAAIKMPGAAPLDVLCVLACGVSTGLGAAFNRAKVRPGSTAAIFGLGGVGLGALMGCVLSGAKIIYAIDILEEKLNLAGNLGATGFINSLKESPLEAIISATGGVDYAFECIGNTQVMEQAYECLAPNGIAVVVGGAPPSPKLSLNPLGFLTGQKTITGCSGNGGNVDDITKYVELYLNGKLPLDKLVGHTFQLEEVNEALAALKRGETGKCVILF